MRKHYANTLYPTLKNFLHSTAKSAHLRHPNCSTLYVRKGSVGIRINGHHWRCVDTITIASIEVRRKGQGTFRKIVDYIVQEGYAVYVESVVNKRFAIHLKRNGYARIEYPSGKGVLNPSFVFNHEGHLREWGESPILLGKNGYQ